MPAFNDKTPPIDYLVDQQYQAEHQDHQVPKKSLHIPFLMAMFFLVFIGAYILFIYSLDSHFYQNLGIDYAIFSFQLFPLFLESSSIVFNLLKLFFGISLLIALSAYLFYTDIMQTWLYEKPKRVLTLIYSLALLLMIGAVAVLWFPLLPHFYNIALALVLYFLSISYICFTLFTQQFNVFTSQRKIGLTRFSATLVMILLSLIILPDAITRFGQSQGQIIANELKMVIQKCDEMPLAQCQEEIDEFKAHFNRYPISMMDTAEKDNRIYVLQCTPYKCAGLFVAASYNKKTLNSLIFSPQRYSSEIPLHDNPTN